MKAAASIISAMMFEPDGVYDSVLRQTVFARFAVPEQATAFLKGYQLYIFDVQFAVEQEMALIIQPVTEGDSFRVLLRSYIAEVKAKTGKTITNEQIAASAGYQDDTELKRLDSPRATRAARQNFLRVLLVEKPHLR